MTKVPTEVPVVKTERRNLLKFLLVGAGAFVLGKLSNSLSGIGAEPVINSGDFQNFKFVETKKNLTLYEKNGEELLVVEKDSF